MHTTFEVFSVSIDPAASLRDLLLGVNVIKCRLPRIGPLPTEPYRIDIKFINLGCSCSDAKDLRHVFYEALFEKRLRPLSVFEALTFNRLSPISQIRMPFVIERYAFGQPNFDPYDKAKSQDGGGLEFSSVAQFAASGTSRYLRIAATTPTDIDRDRFDGEVLETALQGISR